MGAVGTQAHLIFPRRILPGIDCIPPLETVEEIGRSAEGCRELTDILRKWRRASEGAEGASGSHSRKEESLQPGSKLTSQQDRGPGPQLPVASLIQQFEGRKPPQIPHLTLQLEQEDQQSDLDKPRTPPKLESPLSALHRESRAECAVEEELLAASDAAPPKSDSSSLDNLTGKASLALPGKEQHSDRLPGSLPAYWPTFSISVGDASPNSGSQDTAAQQAPTQASPSQASPVSSASPGAPIMTYAELLARETSAMRNAQGPWKPRIEKSEELLKFESNIKRLRCRYERMELLKQGSRQPATRRSFHNKRPFSAPSAQLDVPTGSDSPQLSLALAVDATSAGAAAAGAWAAKRLPRPCFNGGQVVDVLPAWALDLQRPPTTLLKLPAPTAAAQSYQGDQSHGALPGDAAEAAAMRLLERAAIVSVTPSQPSSSQRGMAIPAACERPPVDALSAGSIEQQQHAGSSFAATTSALQNATSAASVAAPVLQQAALLAWAGLEGGFDMCGATLQSAPLVGRLAGLPEPASSGPSRPVRLLRWGIAGVYGTAGALKGIRDGIAQLRGQH
ncbi:hypothetical protein CVIRNUC_009567 [Coccomyxa viridis]|uniref:Uncharacterized protein n=1 Tax=Coccomyxa viridis TaxID=1274662 RepID=A0AAV1IGY8_9CHLO|nr:hypothetical protein CVIRNUC_009567 [Coccomyxa viridis]